jgi:hypothetical protein
MEFEHYPQADDLTNAHNRLAAIAAKERSRWALTVHTFVAGELVHRGVIDLRNLEPISGRAAPEPLDVIAQVEPQSKPGAVITLRVPQCPYCGKQHIHGGGADMEHVERFGGHREAHCAGLRTPGYNLVLEQPQAEHSSAM